MLNKLNFHMLKVWLLGLGLCLLPNSCSKKEVEEEVQEEEGSAQEEEATAESEGEEQVDDAASDLASSEQEVPEQLNEDASANTNAPMANTAPVPASPPALGSGMVMYVKSNGAKMLSEASSGASAVGTLDKGDHLLVEVQGEFARTSSNTFVAMKDLSSEAVGRKRSKNPWRSK